MVSISGLGRAPGAGKGYPLQYSGLENSMNGIVHGVAESDRTERLSLYFLMKHTHNIILQVEDIWGIPRWH